MPPSSAASTGVASPVAGASKGAKREGKSCPAGSSTAARSSVFTRSTAVMPRIVANAEMPSTSNTTSDFRLPPPRRTRLLLPQPDASTMPKPNIVPPTMLDSHSNCGAA